MTIERRLRTASHELREIEVAVPDRLPRPPVSRVPMVVVPILMAILAGAIAFAGLGQGADVDSEPVVAAPVVADQPPTVDAAASTAEADDAATAPPLDDSYDLQRELRLIRALSRRPATTSGPPALDVAAPDARSELELIDALVQRDRRGASAPVPSPERPIVGLI